MSVRACDDLIAYLAEALRCSYLSDLRFLDRHGRDCLSAVVAAVRAEDYPLRQWNDALEYLAWESPRYTAELAKAALLQKLA